MRRITVSELIQVLETYDPQLTVKIGGVFYDPSEITVDVNQTIELSPSEPDDEAECGCINCHPDCD